METSKWAAATPKKVQKATTKPPTPPAATTEAAPVESKAFPGTAETALPPAQSTVPTATPAELFPSIAPETSTAPVFDIAAGEYSMDDFASSRPPDDLFGDEFTPIEEPIIQSTTESEIKAQPTTAVKPPRAPAKERESGPRKMPSDWTRAQVRHKNHVKANPAPPTPVAADGTPAPSGPKLEAVRGDRSSTGGVVQKKITEEELSKRMEEIKLRNVTREAAHARAEADEAQFREMEAKAAAKQREERSNRMQMLGEREKNRQRKLNAAGWREWDVAKAEDGKGDGKDDGKSQYHRGANGGIVPENVKNNNDYNSTVVPAPAHRVPDRGGKRAGGRGGTGAVKATPQSVLKADDFPELPPAAKGPTSTAPAAEGVEATQEAPKAAKADEAAKESSSAAEGPKETPPTEEPAKAPLGVGTQLKQGSSWADEMDNV